MGTFFLQFVVVDKRLRIGGNESKQSNELFFLLLPPLDSSVVVFGTLSVAVGIAINSHGAC